MVHTATMPLHTSPPQMTLGTWVQVPPPAEALKRLPIVVFGLVCFGVGISMLLLANLGAAPWDLFHQGLENVTGISIGVIILLVGLALIVLFPLVGERLGLGTILNVLVIGPVVNVCLALFDEPDAMWLRVALMIGGPIVIAIGSGFYIGGGLGPGPRDGLMTGIAKRGIKIWKVRTVIESTVVVAGVLLGGTIGLGTVWFTVSIGPAVQFFLRRLTFLPALAEPSTGVHPNR